MDALERSSPPSDLGCPDPVDEAQDDEEVPQVWREGGTWWTFFPPPEGFDGEEQGELGDEDYRRTLTGEEAMVMEVRDRAANEAGLARCCALRDRCFGLPPRGISAFPPLVGSRNFETSE